MPVKKAGKKEEEERVSALRSLLSSLLSLTENNPRISHL